MRWIATIAAMLVWLTDMGLNQAQSGSAETVLRQAPTATPAQVDLFSVAPTQEQLDLEDTPTWTPTPLSIAQLEALEAANVRAQPDPNAELLGQIRPGEYYNVIRRYYRWLEFQYDQSPTRRGWVFEDLVQILGDSSVIPVVESLDEEVGAVDDLNSTATALVVTQTPGALLTATAVARGGAAASAPQSDFSIAQITQEMIVGEALPTFTYPPGIAALAPTEAAAAAAPAEAPGEQTLNLPAPGDLPPMLPIAALSLLGLLGLMLSSFRR